MFVPSAKMLTVILHTLTVIPVGNFIVADDHRVRAFGYCDAISYMIAMSMADENKIRLNSIRGNGRGGIPGQKGIDNDFISTSLKSKGSMSIPGQFRRHTSLLFHQV